jgi:sirohydrochlorin ferrochelatase
LSTGIVVFAHGSRVESANESVRTAAAALARLGSFRVEPAFLELGTPDLEGAVLQLLAQGVTNVVVVPYFLTLGLHMERDLPRLIADISSKHKDLQISVTDPLDGHPALVKALLDRARSALS